MEEKTLEQLKGTVENITYRREDTDFCVIEISAEDELVTAVGVMNEVMCGEEVILTGSWDNHSNFGREFRVELCQQFLPESAGAILRYLSSGAIKGVGPVMAEKIVSAFGDDTFNVLENEPERIAGIKGISEKKAREFSRAFKTKFEIREVMMSLTSMGLTGDEALNTYKIFKNEAVSAIEENPYVLCTAIGMKFERADEISGNIPKIPLFEYRANAGVVYVLTHNMGIGHTCIPRNKIIAPCTSLLECGEDDVEIIIDQLIDEKQIIGADINGKEFLFLPNLYHAEKNIANRFTVMEKFPPAGAQVFPGEISAFEKVADISLDSFQRKAVELAVERGLLILTGGPGTGKTTAVKGIISLMTQRGLNVVLAAPTGRAAKRMSELTGFEAKTLHRLLEVEWGEKSTISFKRCAQNPLETDAVIVDELSMVDVLLFDALLEAMPLGCRLIMVGDSDQLPPVGAGNVLSDLISSGKIPTVKLERVFRQEKQSMIVENAHKIVKGEIPDLTAREKDSDFFFMNENNPYFCAEKVLELAVKRLPAAYGYSPFSDIQVLCPSRKGEVGTYNINRLLQNVLNPKEKGKRELAYNGYVLREGDKVMQIKNNYDVPWSRGDEDGMGVFNGDIGILKSIDMASGTMRVAFDDKEAVYSFESAREIELAYAMTVHKSQGSEFPAVIMPVLAVPEPLCYRNLLYTAVTRAKNMMVVIGSGAVVKKMVGNNKKSRRYSALNYFFKQPAEEITENINF